ncbi:MAG: hypothetical protein IT322_06180 [Anaerolineae bacterium]|nr:hypothetical protein [Anaerolineae bacterium]
MNQKLYRKESSGGVYTLNPQSHYVTLPTSTIDLWMPLIGAVGVGVYAMYRRLAREGRVCGSDLKRMAKAARISDNTLRSLNRTLEKIGFIAVEKPEGVNRMRHYTTEIHLLEPPTSVPAELIRELECQSGYEIVAHWLVESDEAHPADNPPPSGNPAQRVETTKVTPLPQPRPQGDTGFGGAPQASPQRTIPPLPQPRPRGDTSLGGTPQASPQRTIPPLPQPRPQRNTSVGGTPQASPQRTIPPLPQPRPQETGGTGFTSAKPRLSMPSSGPVALSSVIESAYQRQLALMSAPHSAIQREPAFNSAPGSAAKRVMEAPTSATLESLSIESLREWEESPLPLISENLQAPISPQLPWNDSQRQDRSSQPTAPARSSPSSSGIAPGGVDPSPRGAG